MPDLPPYPGIPRWVKVSGVIAIALALLVVILQHTGAIGRHGPRRHGGGQHQALPGDTSHSTPGRRGADIPHGGGGHP